MPGPSGGKGEKGDVGIAGLPGALVSYHSSDIYNSIKFLVVQLHKVKQINLINPN